MPGGLHGENFDEEAQPLDVSLSQSSARRWHGANFVDGAGFRSDSRSLEPAIFGSPQERVYADGGYALVGESDSADQKRAFVYTKGQSVELDKLAENLSEAGFNSLDVASGINDKGWMVGYGTTSGSLTAAFVAVPEGRGNQRQATPPQPQSQHRGQAKRVSESNEEDYDVFYTRLSSDEGNWVEAGNY